jgi:hypothetical protein
MRECRCIYCERARIEQRRKQRSLDAALARIRADLDFRSSSDWDRLWTRLLAIKGGKK